MRFARGTAAVALLALVGAVQGPRLGAQSGGAARPQSPAAAAPATDIFLADLRVEGGVLKIGRPERVTDRADNDRDGLCRVLRGNGALGGDCDENIRPAADQLGRQSG